MNDLQTRHSASKHSLYASTRKFVRFAAADVAEDAEICLMKLEPASVVADRSGRSQNAFAPFAGKT
ncbi:hypothetical protein DWB67_13810 [Paracoccus sp. JM45]|nr:hypothetical protein DWB67_13810 [Paracoccus sp. JM45]